MARERGKTIRISIITFDHRDAVNLYCYYKNQDFTVDRGWIVPIIDDEDYDIDQDGRQLGKTGASSGQHTPALQAAWLTAHNKRRKAWHTRYGKSFVPVKWNEPLAQQAKSWAEHLLGSCGHGDPVHGKIIEFKSYFVFRLKNCHLTRSHFV